MMEHSQLREHFQVFGLTTFASLPRLDEVYHHVSQDLLKRKAEDPRFVRQQQQMFDDSYYLLLQHFIRQDCQQGGYCRNLELAHANVVLRRDDPGAYSKSPQLTRRAASRMAQERADFMEGNAVGPSEKDYNNGNGKEDVGTRIMGEDTGSDSGEQPHTPSVQNPFKMVHMQGDIFDAPDNAVIVHAVNCQGVWGAGFAKALKLRFPAAYTKYVEVCRNTQPKGKLAGNCVLIPPQSADFLNSHGESQPRRWIACLYTSVGYGPPSVHSANPGRDDKATILMHTDSALVDLKTILKNAGATEKDDRPSTNLYSPKFNAGNFRVAWKHTEELIDMCFAGYDGRWYVVSSDKEDQ